MTIQRTGRLMKGNASTAVPQYIIALDTETRPVQFWDTDNILAHHFRLGVAKVGRYRDGSYTDPDTYKISSQDQFWNLVYATSGRRHTTWIIAHNALFDMITTGMVREFDEARLTLDIPRSKRKRESNSEDDSHSFGLAVLESPPTIIGMKSSLTEGRIVAVDTLNWFQCSLSELGANLGRDKLPMPQWNDPDSLWYDYCDRDCEIVYYSFAKLVEWVKNNDMGMFRYTGAAQSMAAYRHRFASTPIYIHDNMDVKAVERCGYFGGRVEVFKKGRIIDDVHVVDCNSLFPSVMQNGFFPSKLTDYHLSDDYIELIPDIDYGAAVAEVIVETEEPVYPVRVESMTIYPIGRFNTVLCGKELEYAKNRGSVKAIKSYACYEMSILFNRFVTELYNMRLEYGRRGNQLYKQFTKTILNSLYGKFGQLAPKWIPEADNYSGIPWYQWAELDNHSGEKAIFRSIGWHTFRKVDRGERQDSFVAISAFITSAARMRMNEFRQIAGRENVYYQGVDGLIVNNRGLVRLTAEERMDSQELGKLRLVQSTNEGEIYGCADYRVGGKIVVAGRHHNALQTENDLYAIRRFSGERELFSGVGRDCIVEQVTSWRRSHLYRKGVVNDDGWIDPIRIDCGC
jgi:hypothetical protein